MAKLKSAMKSPRATTGEPRSTEAIMRDVNRAFEIAVRRDPANWFWVHRRWKGCESKVQSPESKVKSANTVA